MVDQNGNVKVLNAGMATIDAAMVDNYGQSHTASYQLSVKKPVEFSQITLMPENSIQAMNMGSKQLITADVINNQDGYKSLIWQSSDSSILSVDQNGLMTAVLPGNATVTLKLVDVSGKEWDASYNMGVQLLLPASLEGQRTAITKSVVDFSKKLNAEGVSYTDLTPFGPDRWQTNNITYTILNPDQTIHAKDGDITAQQLWTAAATAWNLEFEELGSNINLTPVASNGDMVDQDVSNEELSKLTGQTDASGTAGWSNWHTIGNMFVPQNTLSYVNEKMRDTDAWTKAELIADATHEIGHTLDLLHSDDRKSVLWYETKDQSLQKQDAFGVILASELPAGLDSTAIGRPQYVAPVTTA